jgi:hypothetical protein
MTFIHEGADHGEAEIAQRKQQTKKEERKMNR